MSNKDSIGERLQDIHKEMDDRTPVYPDTSTATDDAADDDDDES